MAREQKRGNREIRKPKKEKKPAKIEIASGAQVKNAVNGFAASKKSRR